MRALYFPNSFEENNSLLIEGDKAHHLINVIRVKVDDQILLLNGQGTQGTGSILEINKRSVKILINSIDKVTPPNLVDVAVGLVKKEAFDLCLKMATELGVSNFYPLKTQYAQSWQLNDKRTQRVLESALEQSNNPLMLNCHNLVELQELPISQYDKVLYFSSQSEGSESSLSIAKEDRILLILGPEGGFSPNEESSIKSLQNSHLIHLKGPIMRTPTALACAFGFAQSLRMY